MSNKTELQEARSEMLAVLDEKLASMPEWRAFRAIEKALGAMPDTPKPALTGGRVIHKTVKIAPSYASLAVKAIQEKKRPVTTGEMVEYISARRVINAHPKAIRINIQSALSKDERIQSVPWAGGRAWWHAGRAVPVDGESAGLGLTQTPPNTPSA